MPRDDHRKHWCWIVARDETGKIYLISGSGDDEADTSSKALEMGLSEFTVKRYPTRDIATASRLAKGGRLERGEALKASSARMGHERSLHRRLVRRGRG